MTVRTKMQFKKLSLHTIEDRLRQFVWLFHLISIRTASPSPEFHKDTTLLLNANDMKIIILLRMSSLLEVRS